MLKKGNKTLLFWSFLAFNDLRLVLIAANYYKYISSLLNLFKCLAKHFHLPDDGAECEANNFALDSFCFRLLSVSFNHIIKKSSHLLVKTRLGLCYFILFAVFAPIDKITTSILSWRPLNFILFVSLFSLFCMIYLVYWIRLLHFFPIFKPSNGAHSHPTRKCNYFRFHLHS